MTVTAHADSGRGAPADPYLRMMLFRLGEGDFGMPVAAVEEVAPCGAIEAVPSAPAFLAGTAGVRGEQVPVVDLARHLAIPATPTHRSRLLLVRAAGRRLGLMVDEVLGVEVLEAASVSPVPERFLGPSREYLDGVARFGERLVILLEPHRLISDAQRDALAALDLSSSG